MTCGLLGTFDRSVRFESPFANEPPPPFTWNDVQGVEVNTMGQQERR